MERGAWYERQLQQVAERRAQARAGLTCLRCGVVLVAATSTKKYCSVACQKAYLYRLAHPNARVRKPKVEPSILPPVPAIETDHEVVQAALGCLKGYEKAEIASGVDSIALDLIGEYCLATLEGLDPAAAVQAFRSRLAKDRMALIHGLSTVTGLER